MVTIRDFVDLFPDRFPVRTDQAAQDYYVEPGLFAWRGPLPMSLTDDRVAGLQQEQITILRMVSDQLEIELRDEAITAVYSLPPKGPLFVPTGRVFVRFDRRLRSREFTSQLEDLGFSVIEVPPYAPHAAWVAHESGHIYSSLIKFRRIQSLDGVENVEPQMLTSRVARQAK